jgi:hypothetical protein
MTGVQDNGTANLPTPPSVAPFAISTADTNAEAGTLVVTFEDLDSSGILSYSAKFTSSSSVTSTGPGSIDTTTGSTGTVTVGSVVYDIDLVKISSDVRDIAGSVYSANVTPYTAGQAANTGATLVGRYRADDDEIVLNALNATKNASLLLEVTNVNDITGAVTFKATSNILERDGSVSTRVNDVTLRKNTTDLDISDLIGGASGELTANLASIEANDTGIPNSTTDASAHFKVGDKLAYNILASKPSTATNERTFQVTGRQNTEWEGAWDSTSNSVTYNTPASK